MKAITHVVRLTLEAFILWSVARNAHWSVALALALITVRLELDALFLGKLVRGIMESIRLVAAARR